MANPTDLAEQDNVLAAGNTNGLDNGVFRATQFLDINGNCVLTTRQALVADPGAITSATPGAVTTPTNPADTGNDVVSNAEADVDTVSDLMVILENETTLIRAEMVKTVTDLATMVTAINGALDVLEVHGLMAD